MSLSNERANPQRKEIDTMTNKMTKREMFLEIRTYLTEQHHLDFIDHELELLDLFKQLPDKYKYEVKGYIKGIISSHN